MFKFLYCVLLWAPMKIDNCMRVSTVEPKSSQQIVLFKLKRNLPKPEMSHSHAGCVCFRGKSDDLNRKIHLLLMTTKLNSIQCLGRASSAKLGEF